LDKHIFIINGSGGVGKDTFVELVSTELNDILKKFHTVINFSSIDKVKEIAREIGWNGKKSEKDRKFLSDLKILTSEYCDMPFKSMKNKVAEFMNDEESIFLFLHIREPEEIARAVNEFGAKTILVTRDAVKHIVSNMADENVFNYNYDFVVNNSGTKEELNIKAKDFVQEVIDSE
jgi:nucleoside-triphosphatase THEP1